MEEFDEFTISIIPRGQNDIADSLATSASIFKIPIFPNKKYEVQVKHRPSIPHNVKNWQVFEDNHQIKIFLENYGEFVNTQIDDENQLEEEESFPTEGKIEYLNVFGGKEVIQLKNNSILKGLVPLEELFDRNDVAKNP